MSYPGTAPCGHRGEHIIGTFVRCLEGCDDKPKVAAVASASLATHSRQHFGYRSGTVLRLDHLEVASPAGLAQPAQGKLECTQLAVQTASPYEVWCYTPTVEEVASELWILRVLVPGLDPCYYSFRSPKQISWTGTVTI